MDAHSKKLKFLTKRENITTNQTEMKSTITKEDTKMNLQQTEKGTDQRAARQSSENHCHQKEEKKKQDSLREL